MAYQINLTGKEIDERLQNVGTAKDKAAADGTLYARIKKNADDIAENKENVKTLIKRVDVVTGTANGAEALAKANEKRLNTVTGTANTAKELAQKNQFNLGQVQATANTALKNSEVNQDSVRNAQITANEAKALVEGLTTVVRGAENDISQLKELNVVYPNNLRKLTVDSTPDEIKKSFIPEIGGTPGTTNTPHVGYLIKGNRNSDNDGYDPDSTIISVEVVKIDDKDCHKFMYIDNNRDLVTMTVCIWGGTFKVIERSVVSNIDTVMTTLTEHDARQTNIEEVVSGAQKDAYFTLKWFNLVFSDSRFNGNIDNVKVRLYRWSGKRYAQFVMFTRNGTGVSQEPISYEIILKQKQANGANVRVPYIHYNDDGTEEELWLAVKDDFGGRISYNRYKKRRWRIQAFLNDKPITAPFDFRVSIDANNNASITKRGMMRSVPTTGQVKYDGYYDVDKWLNCERGEELDLTYYLFYDSNEKIRRKFPNPGDVMVKNAFSHVVSRGVIISVFQDTPGSYCILWSDGESIYEIGIDLDTNEYGGYNCYYPAKKLCDDIYDYASKMNSGTLRDLYISAGAVYNEATGYYELNGLTDITEEEMRTIYEKTWGWWLALPNLSGFGDASVRTNIPCPDYKRMYYQTTCSLNSSFARTQNINKLEVLNFIPLKYPSDDFIKLPIRNMNWIFQSNTKPLTIMGILDVAGVSDNNSLNIGGNIKSINIKNLFKNISFYESKVLSKESVLYMINNSVGTNAFTISLNKEVYDVMKDDADIIAALAEKTNITLIQNT